MNAIIKLSKKVYNLLRLYKIKWRLKIKHYMPNSKRKERKAVYKDYLKERENVWGITIDEYFSFNFSALTKSQRSSFVSDLARIKICDALNKKENKEIFDNKILTYEHFKKYYKRDLIFVKNPDDADAFNKFIENKSEIIVKPIDGAFGNGVRKLEIDSNKDDLFDEILKLYSSHGCVVEEVVKNVKEFEEFHPNSLNTVRVCTIRMDNRVEIFAPFARLGVGKAVVDNAGSGGIIASIDVGTGEITAAANENGTKFEIHPDSNKMIVGFKIPKWDELLLIVKECAQIIPSNRYVGWDFALTNNGWVMIEANARGQFVTQYADGIGVWDRLEPLLEELNIKFD